MKRLLLSILIIFSILNANQVQAAKSQNISGEKFLDLCRNGTAQEIINAINSGANVNAKDDDGTTAFMIASAVNKDSEVINALIKAGADVNAKTSFGGTALMSAAAVNSPEIVNILLSAGADVNAKNYHDLTALMYAASNSEYPEIINMLINSGADVKARDQSGKSALDYARNNENLKGSEALKRLEELSK
ncbi:MAG: ankyrin repeat domain-containing protein [Synergistaceae bacterium]|nr:ankyrin repeat domain-containing protein [Synergistaceae bacterium]